MVVRVNGRRWTGVASAAGYVGIDREWRDGDRIEVTLPMTLRAEPLPGAADVIAFLYGPIVLAGRFGQQGLAPRNQIIVNERESGSMLRRTWPSRFWPATGGHWRRIHKDPHRALTFRTAGAGRPRDVELAPYYRLAHERYNLYWTLVPG
jgi:Uncharacterized protein conserved in bacteria